MKSYVRSASVVDLDGLPVFARLRRPRSRQFAVPANDCRGSARCSATTASPQLSTSSLQVSFDCRRLFDAALECCPFQRLATLEIVGNRNQYACHRVPLLSDSDITISHLQEVLEQVLALAGQDRFGVELHALHGVAAVADAHDHAAVGLRRHLQLLRARCPGRSPASGSGSPRTGWAGRRRRPCRRGGSSTSCRARSPPRLRRRRRTPRRSPARPGRRRGWASCPRSA